MDMIGGQRAGRVAEAALLIAMTTDQITVRWLSGRLAVPVSTAHAILETLEAEGLVRHVGGIKPSFVRARMVALWP